MKTCKNCKYAAREGFNDYVNRVVFECRNKKLEDDYVMVYDDSYPITVAEDFGCIFFEPGIYENDCTE